MDRLTIGIAEAISSFKFNTDPKDMSPPYPDQETLAVRNLAIIDLTNKIADVVADGDETTKEEFLKRSLRSKS